VCAAAGLACAAAFIAVGAAGANPARSDIGRPASEAGPAAPSTKDDDHSEKSKPEKRDKAEKPEKPERPEKPDDETPPTDATPQPAPAPRPDRPHPKGDKRGPKKGVGAECGAADRPVTKMRPAVAERALLCVINFERARHGAPALVVSRSLGRPAASHSRDMVRRRYFAHDTKGGSTWVERVKAGGYTDAARTYRIGETLAWAGEETATARSRVQAWLDSKPHRKVMLREGYREIGIGIARGTPVGVPGATFTADYGRVS